MATNKTPDGNTRAIGVRILVVVLFIDIVCSIAYTKVHDDEFFRNREARLAAGGSAYESDTLVDEFILTAEHESKQFPHFDRSGRPLNVDYDIDPNVDDVGFIIHRNGGNKARDGFDQIIPARRDRGPGFVWPRRPQGYTYVTTTFQLLPGSRPTKFKVTRYP